MGFSVSLLFVTNAECSRTYHVTSSCQHFPTGQGYINFADSITPLTFTTFYKEGSSSKLYVNSTWIKTTSDLTVTAFFSNNYFNYTTSAGTQQMSVAKPEAVYFDGDRQLEGDTWSHSGGVLTVTPSGTDVAVTWTAPSNPDVPEVPVIEIPIFVLPSILQFLFEGDLFGFFQSLFGTAFLGADVFFAFVAFIVSMALYTRTKSLILLTILALLTLGAGFMVAMPLVAGFGVLLTIFGVAGLLHQLYSSRLT